MTLTHTLTFEDDLYPDFDLDPDFDLELGLGNSLELYLDLGECNCEIKSILTYLLT